MAIEFCDWEPCPLLKKFVTRFRPKDHKEGTVQADVVIQKGPGKGREARVTLWYCPFCGTRIHDNEDVQNWLNNH
jgi:hypothetical protein